MEDTVLLPDDVMRAVVGVPTDDLGPTDTFMILTSFIMQTTSVLPLNFALHITDVDSVADPTECMT